MARPKYKNFRDGLFRIGDVVEVTVKGRSERRPNGGRTEPTSVLTGLIIDEIGRDRMCFFQDVVDPRGEGLTNQQYFTFHRTDVVKIRPLRSEAWTNEYQPGADGTRPRSRRRLRDEMPPLPEYEPYEWEDEAAEELGTVLDDAATRRQRTYVDAYTMATEAYPDSVGSNEWWAAYNQMTTTLAEGGTV